MNCAECQERLVASVEGLLEGEESLQCQAHLESCATCRAEEAAVARLQKRLAAHGQAAAGVSLVVPVMRRVRAVQTKQESDSIMRKLFTPWGFGLGTAATAGIVLLGIFLFSPKTAATAAEVMARGAKAIAKLSSVHLRGQLRTPPADNFSAITPDADFVTLELWKQFEPELKWRVEKPGRFVVMDGQSTIHYMRPANVAVKVQASRSAFDTDWFHRLANLSDTITDELKNAAAKGWKLSLTEARAADGRVKSTVTVMATSGLPENDYLKNKFFDDADTRRVYRFDAQSELLEGVQIYLTGKAGEVLIFELQQIDYNQPIAPAVFHADLPADVKWYQEPRNQPGDEKYAALTPEQAARAFFEACGRSDWAEVGKFWPAPMDDRLKQFLGGLELVSLGQPFTSQGYGGRFIPYEIKLKEGGVKKHNLAVRNDNPLKRWFVDGGL